MNIIINVVGQTMTAANASKNIVAGTQEFVRFTFNLDEDWDNLISFAQFRQASGAYNMLLDENNECYLPSEIQPGTCTIMLYGNGGEHTIGVSNYLTLIVSKNKLIEDVQSTQITQTLYDQLVTRVNSLITWNDQKTAELTRKDNELQAQLNQMALADDLADEIARATAAENALQTSVNGKANQSDVAQLRLEVDNFVNNETVASMIQVAVEGEIENYLSSGQLASMTIADGSIAEAKLSTSVQNKLNSAVGAMSPATYDPQGLQMDIFAYAKARADAAKAQADQLRVELGENYVLPNNPERLYGSLAETLAAAVSYNESYTQSLLADYKAFSILIVDELPQVGNEMTFYLVPNGSRNGYEKYWWIKDGNTYKWDTFGSSSTLVVSSLPETGDPDVDYILKNSEGCIYYKYINGLWEVVAGSLALVCTSLPETGSSYTDYYLLSIDTGKYSHYRWINGAYHPIGTATYTQDELDHYLGVIRDDIDTINTGLGSLQSAINVTNGNVNRIEADIDALGNLVSDITENSTGVTVHYKDGTSKNVTTKDGEVTVVDVNRSENGILITYSDEDTKEIEISGGGGGQASGGSAYIERVGGSSHTCVYGGSCPISFNFTALDSSGDVTGSGAGEWYVGSVKKGDFTVGQGLNTFDVGDYLSVGVNTLKLYVTVDTGGSTPTVVTKTWTVNAVNMYVQWDYDDSTINEAETVTIRYTAYGNVTKDTHIKIDGEEVAVKTTTRSVNDSYTFNRLSHGSHMVEIYSTATINGTDIQSDSVFHDMIFVETGNSTPIISCSFGRSTMMQYDTVSIPVVVYTPGQLTSNAVLAVNGSSVATWTNLDKTVHYWNYSPNTYGTKTLTITCGDTVKTLQIEVTELDIDNEEVPGYAFRLKASDLANNNALQDWNSNGVTASFSANFDWTNGGIKDEIDENGYIRQFIKVKAGTRMTINYKLFGNDAKVYGKNFKIIFKPTNSRDYDALFMDCMSDGIGIQLKANGGTASSEQNTVNIHYAENDYTEFEFDVTADSGYRYIQTYIDGVMSSVNVYASNDNFTQITQKDIVIGSDDCDVNIYMVKAYEVAIDRDGHIENFIADAPNAQEMVARYDRNDILGDNGEIDYEKLAVKNPKLRIHLWDIPRMTEGKKDYVDGCTYQQIFKGADQSHQITADGVTIAIQGTSSVDYKKAGANTDGNFTNGFTDGNGNHIDGYSMTEDSVPVNYFNTKVNIASCENVNNMCLAEWYNRFQPYKRSLRRKRPVRDCMELHMGVQFIKDRSHGLFNDDNYHMYAICNMGNSKKNVTVFHDAENPLEAVLEVKDNNSTFCLMHDSTFSIADLDTESYFEFRYPSSPDTAMKQAFVDFVNWFAANNPRQATNAALTSPVTYGEYTFRGTGLDGDVLGGTTISDYAGTYTTDSYEYRMAKLLDECEDHLIMDSVVYHYVFVEEHAMVDNCVKNTFWGTDDCVHWYLCHNYDNDTADGNDNNGALIIPEYSEGMDTMGVRDVFNGRTSVWWTFVYGLYPARRAMWINREAAGAWRADDYNAYVKSEQDIVPERVWNEDYWYKYLRLYETESIDRYLPMLEGGKKNHQRARFVTNNMYYMASQYMGTTNTSRSITMRGYTPAVWAGVEPKSEVTIVAYNKCYIVVQIGDIYKRVKAEKGESKTIVFTESGNMNDTVINLHGANMIQAVDDLSHLYIGRSDFSAATRLRSLQIGSTEAGYSNSNLTEVGFGANTMLEELYIQNCPNVTNTLDLSGCQALLKLDVRGSGFTGITFATGGLIQNALLCKPYSLTMRSLYGLSGENLSLEDATALRTLRLEDCPNIDTLEFVTAATGLNRLRMLGINWTIGATDILNRLWGLTGLDENDHNVDKSVLTGYVFVDAPIRNIELNNYASAWNNLTVDYNPTSLIEQYKATYVNADGTVLYETWVDRGSTPPDIVDEGIISTPTMEPTDQYIFTYNGWENLTGGMLAARTITASYIQTTRTYTVRWFKRTGILLSSMNGVEYGSEVSYEGETPTDESEEGTYIYNVFAGWNKSTGFIKGDTDVYAIWERAELPNTDKELMDMSAGEIFAVAKSGRVSDYFEYKDYFDFKMGHDFNFTNVSSAVFANDVVLDGSTFIDTGITLFGEDETSFTMAIDYRFLGTTLNSTLVSAYEESGQEGFRLRYNGGPNVQWGNTAQVVGYQKYREMVVLRHRKGDDNLYIYVSNGNIASVFSDSIQRYVIQRTRLTTQALKLGLGATTFIEDGGHDDYGIGHIYWGKVWFDDLGETNCRKLASWTRETMRMEFCGSGRYRLAGGGSQRCNASFISNNLFTDRRRVMNPTNTNAGGWDQCTMRTFMNTRVLSGMPEVWQNILKKVRILATEGNGSTNITVSEDYLYLPANAEMQSTTDSTYSGEGELIPWFTSTAARAKFMGAIIPENSTVFEQTNDPCNDINNAPAFGDRWKRSNNAYYYFASPEMKDRIGNIVESVVVASDNVNYWVPAYYFWTRSPGLGGTASFWFVHWGGYMGYYDASSARAGCLCFSI